MTRGRSRQGGRPPGIEVRNREQLRYDLARIGDRHTVARRLAQAIEEDQRRSARKYPYLPRGATVWGWLDKGKNAAWPGHALRDLAQFIRDQTGKPCDRDAWVHPAGPAFQVCNAPRSPSLAFRGREREIEELRALLARGADTGLCAIEGLPGIGKSELALQLAHGFAVDAVASSRPLFPGGIFWLHAENRDLREQWDEIARKSLKLQGGTLEERVAEAIGRIERSPDPSLLILDNASLARGENWESGKPSPLPEGAQIRLLVTTRNDYFGGSAFRQRRLGVLAHGASRELLLEVSGLDARRDASRIEGLDELLDALGGHALALEISGVYLQKNGSETPRSFLDRIALGERFERQARHTGYAVKKSDYEATIHGAFTALWTSLDAETRAAWQRAAHFETAPTTVELSEAAGLSTAATEALQDFHLIDWDGDGRRWVMHRLTRSFGREIGTAEEREAARSAFVRGCAALAAQIQGPGSSVYLADRAHFDAAVALAAEFLPAEAELAFLLAVGPALLAQRGYASDESWRIYQRAVELADQTGRHDQVFFSLEGLWQIRMFQADWRAAGEITERMLELAERHGSQEQRLISYLVQGERALYTGKLQDAHAWYERGVPLVRAIEPGRFPTVQHPGVRVLHGASLARCLRGEPDQALRLAGEATRLAEELGNPGTIAMIAFARSILHHMRMEIDVVEEHAGHALELSRRFDLADYRLMGSFFLSWARIARSGEQQRDELDSMRDTLNVLLRMGFLVARPYHLQMFAEACLRLGRSEEALDRIREALRVAATTGERVHDPELWRLRAALSRSPREKLRCLERALRTALEQGSRWYALRATCDLVDAADGTALSARANAQLEELCSSFSEGGELPDLQRARASLSRR